MANRAEALNHLVVALVVAQEGARAEFPSDRQDNLPVPDPAANLISAVPPITPFSRWCVALGLSLTMHLVTLMLVRSEWVAATNPIQAAEPMTVRLDTRPPSPPPSIQGAAEAQSAAPIPDISSPPAEAPESIREVGGTEPIAEATVSKSSSRESAAVDPTEAAAYRPVKPVRATPPGEAVNKARPSSDRPKPSAKPKKAASQNPPRPERKPTARPASPPRAVSRREPAVPNPSPGPPSREERGDTSARRSTPIANDPSPLSTKPRPTRIDAAPLPGNPRPRYPLAARQRGYEGRVVLQVKVSLAGRPDSVEIKTSSGHRLLDQAALETVKSWRFRPARHGGQVVSVVLDVPVVFRLDG